MNLYQIIEKIKKFAKDYPNVGTVVYGDIYSLNQLKDVSYPSVCITNGTHEQDLLNGRMKYTIYIFSIGLLKEDKSNKIFVQSNSMQMIASIANKLQYEDDIYNVTASYDIYAEDKLNDTCAGAWGTLEITTDFQFCVTK